MKIARIVCFALMAAATFLIIQGGVKIIERRLWASNTLTAQGEVVGFAWKSCDQGSIISQLFCPATRVPQVDFTTSKGVGVTFLSPHFVVWPAYRQGDKVSIFYSPDNPADAAIDHPLALYSESVKEGQFGALLLCFAAALLFAMQRMAEEDAALSERWRARIDGIMARPVPKAAKPARAPRGPMAALPAAAPAYVALLPPPRPATA